MLTKRPFCESQDVVSEVREIVKVMMTVRTAGGAVLANALPLQMRRELWRAC